MEYQSVYEGIAARTGGEIYVGVVGPVRTGKSTFIKRFMERLVLPYVAAERRGRAIDELPQSASGKTVMTTEPKFVPEEGVALTVKDATCRVRLVDCVGYPVEGAVGFEEDGEPRLVRTPWSDAPVPFRMAAEEGTRRVICDHSTLGILVTTDGSVTDLPRENYLFAEEKAAEQLKSLQKPYVILLNCKEPTRAAGLCRDLEEKYGAPVLALNVEEASEEELVSVLERVLYEFPVLSIDVDLPDWMRVLDADCAPIAEVLSEIRTLAPNIAKMSDCALLDGLFADSQSLLPPTSVTLDPASGRVIVKAQAKEGAFYQMLGRQCGEEIKDDFALMHYVTELAQAKKLYERVGRAFEEAREYGYGIVPPLDGEMSLSEPKISKKSGRVGVNLHAAAPSYHIIRVDVTGEVRPAVGNEEQSVAFAKELSEGMATEPERAWNTNMFGRTLKEMLGEELTVKNRAMADTVRNKMRKTVTRIVNEGKGGVICILL
ncbi:MAG: stage IV sporulation protein A [Clostridia bacterium]|nr:stage IV sporulation protein A [Clostridia bacterium]